MPLVALNPQNLGLSKLGKKTFLAWENVKLSQKTFFCILKNIRLLEINFVRDVCSQIFVFCIFHANLHFFAR